MFPFIHFYSERTPLSTLIKYVLENYMALMKLFIHGQINVLRMNFRLYKSSVLAK